MNQRLQSIIAHEKAARAHHDAAMAELDAMVAEAVEDAAKLDQYRRIAEAFNAKEAH